MSDSARYARAFAKALAEHLRGRIPSFTHTEYGQGGCETCGYGADQFDALDIDLLEKEIDAFAKTFSKKIQPE